MRTKRWISVLAVLGVLVHAAAIVRHATSLASARLQYHTLLTDLAQLCHGGTRPDAAARSELSYIPPPILPPMSPPMDGQSGCQLCCGLGSAVALLARGGASLLAPAPVTVAVGPGGYRQPQSRHAACPPARGPPALA